MPLIHVHRDSIQQNNHSPSPVQGKAGRRTEPVEVKGVTSTACRTSIKPIFLQQLYFHPYQ